MTEIIFTGGRKGVGSGPPGLKDCPGRNDPRYGAWMIENLIPRGVRKIAPVIADPFCGGGQLWMTRPPGVVVHGCEKVEERAAIARANGLRAVQGLAETWTPPEQVDLIAGSPPFKNANHDSGNKSSLVEDKGLQSMQAIDQIPCFLRVFAQIATYANGAPVAMIVKNHIEGAKGYGKKGQAEVDWVSEIASAMMMAGLGPVRRYFRRVPPGPTEQWKIKRDPAHRFVDREIVLVAGGEVEAESGDDWCPACGCRSLHVGRRIYCLHGCALRWDSHGALVMLDHEYTTADVGLGCPERP